MPRKAIGFAGLLILSVAPVFLQAQELNQRQDVDPRAGAKLMRMQAESMRQNNPQQKQPLTQPTQCGANAGNVIVQKGAQAPREVNTMIKGDVISVCK